MNDLESEITQGFATYIENYSYSPEARIFSCKLFHDPETPKNFRFLTISGIESFEVDIIDEDDECIETIIGVEKEDIENGLYE